MHRIPLHFGARISRRASCAVTALIALGVAGCARKATPLPPPTGEQGSASQGPPAIAPATTLGSEGPLVYRGVLGGATKADRPPPGPGKGMPYTGADENILLASALTPFLEFKIEGYYKSCFDHFVVEVKSGEQWRTVRAALPPKGQYVLDGTSVGYGMCDVVTCAPIERPLRVPLVELVDSTTTPKNAQGWPVYESAPLRGEVRVRYAYFSNDSCTSERVVEHVVLL